MGREGFSPSPEQMFNREGKKPGEIDSFFRDLANKYPKIRKTALMFAVMGATLGFAESAQAQEQETVTVIKNESILQSQTEYHEKTSEIRSKIINPETLKNAISSHNELNTFSFNFSESDRVVFASRGSCESVVNEKVRDEVYFEYKKGELPDGFENVVVSLNTKSKRFEDHTNKNPSEIWSGFVMLSSIIEAPSNIEMKEGEKKSFDSFGSTKERAVMSALETAVSYYTTKVSSKTKSLITSNYGEGEELLVSESSILLDTESTVYIKSYKVVDVSKKDINGKDFYTAQIEVVFGIVE